MPGDETYRMKRKNISADKLRYVNECIQINAENGTKTVWKCSMKYKNIYFFARSSFLIYKIKITAQAKLSKSHLRPKNRLQRP